MGGLLLGPVGLPGRVRLRRPAVPAGARAVHDRRRGGPGAGRRPAVHRPRRRAGRGRVLPRHPRRHRADRRPRLRRDRADLPALPRLGDRRRAARAVRAAGPPPAAVRRRRRRRASAPIGHATEWGWTHLVQTLSLEQRHPRRGHAHGDRRRRGRRPARRAARPRACAAGCPGPAVARTRARSASLVVLAACVTNGLLATVPDDVEATFAHRRRRRATRGRPTSPSSSTRPTSLDDPAWVQITSWQGDGLVVDALERTGEGEYRTTRAGPAPRRLEDAAAGARRPRAHRLPDLPARPTRRSRPTRSPPRTA